MAAASFPRPVQTTTTKPFWDACQEHRLVAMQCQECEAWYWPYSACRNHPNKPFFANMEWREVSGLGTIHSLNIHYRQFTPVFEAPYVYAAVRLDEGPRLPTNVHCPADQVEKLAIGDRVRVDFVDIDEDLTVFQFVPV